MTTYVVPVSGGKDSQVVLSMAVEEHGAENVVGLHNYTGIDHPLTMEHMQWMSEFYGVRIENSWNPKYKDMWDLIDKKNLMPGRNSRFCADELKIRAMNFWLDKRLHEHNDLDALIILMGMRAAESPQRRSNYGDITPDDEFLLREMNPGKVYARFKAVRVRMPIVDKSTPWVFEYLRAKGEKINPLYARGFKRVGCFPCILSGPSSFRLAARDPVGRETIMKLRDFREVLAQKPGSDLTREQVHPLDLDRILDEADFDPFGFNDANDDDGGGCSWCAQ